MSLGSILTNGLENRKIFCAFHKTQFLTNFCVEKDCLMPLCPSCVVEHTEEHYQHSQKPTYVNLNEALLEMKQRCYTHIVGLEDNAKKNEQILKYKENLALHVHQQLGQLKQELYIKIQTLFQKYEVKLLNNIEEHFQANGIYDVEEAQNISQSINLNINALYDKIGLLKTEQCLGALIRFHDHEGEDFNHVMREVQKYVDKHQKIGKPELKLNKELVEHKFQGLCDELITLSFQNQDQNIEKSSSGVKEYHRIRPHESSFKNHNMF